VVNEAAGSDCVEGAGDLRSGEAAGSETRAERVGEAAGSETRAERV
jgi:hypothetical protein